MPLNYFSNPNYFTPLRYRFFFLKPPPISQSMLSLILCLFFTPKLRVWVKKSQSCFIFPILLGIFASLIRFFFVLFLFAGLFYFAFGSIFVYGLFCLPKVTQIFSRSHGFLVMMWTYLGKKRDEGWRILWVWDFQGFNF